MPAPEPGFVGSPTIQTSMTSLMHYLLEKVGGTEVADVMSRPLMIELLALIPDILAKFQKPILRNIIYGIVGIPSVLLALFGDKVGMNIDLRKDLALLGTHELTNIIKDIAHPLGLSALASNWEEIQRSLSLGDPMATLKSLSYIPDILEKAGVSLGFMQSLFPSSKPTIRETKETLVVEKQTFRPIELKIEKPTEEEKKKKAVWRFGIRD